MTSKVVKIVNPTGLHTRPGNQFVKLAKEFEADVTVTKSDKTFNAKSLMKLMKVGISQGDQIEINCDGPDEEDALAKLTEFLANLTE
ncbi:HPr family phosphocarrier protein [Candidatus Haliotispira prima]|uniref:Phosphocarrier protein HPr n=1 Tax=Candidatus Haliotispira prima TaxID=3034016 RepID=A0ABY8MG58_9SPIO|nr:HPr family phosphocarrier protein [Candidatus Haliotispira prima]